MIKIILVEDHQIVRDGIKLLLDTDNTVEIVGEAADGQQAIHLLETGLQADMILSDMTMPVMDGLMLLKRVKVQYPKLKILFLTMIDDPQVIATAIKSGASGYLYKNTEASELMYAIKFIETGAQYLGAELAIMLLKYVPADTDEDYGDTYPDQFTSREIEILQLIAEGLTNIEIGEKLFLSKRTVEGHRQSLMTKFGARTSANLIRIAMLKKLI